MGIYNLDRVFKPLSVAIIGASRRQGSIGQSLVKSVLEAGFKGKIFPINSRYDSILDLPCYPSVKEVNQPVDLALIVTPIKTVPSILSECAAAEVGGTVIISAGGKEIGDTGKEREEEIKRELDAGGVRGIGPNCMGIICSPSKLNACFAGPMPRPGKLAFISQSGALCGAILDRSKQENIGFSYFVSIGSMLDVDFGDLVNYFGNDPDVGSIVLYMENLTNIRKFMSAARAVSRVKPIVVLKAGRSMAGAEAAASHTGALAGEDRAYDAAFQRAGIVRVESIGELFDCAELMAKQPLPSGPGLGILTNGGGPGVMAADALSGHNLEPVLLSPETQKKLDEILPTFWSRRNPIDILGDAPPERWQKAIETCLGAPEIRALIIIFVPQTLSDSSAVARAIVDILGKGFHPAIFAVWMGGERVEQGRRLLNSAGIPTYETPEQAVAAYVHMFSYARNLELLQEIPPKLSGRLSFDFAEGKSIVRNAPEREAGLLGEVEAKRLFEAYGIPVNRTEVCKTAEEAVQWARSIGYPAVMKVLSRHISHKSDVGGVKLNLRSERNVRNAFSEIIDNVHRARPGADIDGVTVQSMIPRPDYELILGSKRDPDFGPVILFGMGGIMTEILRDQAVALPPLNRLLARRLMESTKVYQILKGYRNHPPAKMEILEEILIRLSQLVTDFPEIAELDINPLILAEDRAYAVDARVYLQPSERPSPLHLVISPYPNQYEMMMTAKGGREIFTRPIKPEDAPLLEELFSVLSKQSIYFRFFGPMKSLPPKMLAYFTQIDYDRDIAVVALERQAGHEKMLGVARLMGDPDGIRAELAVLVGDPWQGRGIGAALMSRLIAISKDRGIKAIWGFVLAENTHMLALARKAGFKSVWNKEQRAYELNADVDDIPNFV